MSVNGKSRTYAIDVIAGDGIGPEVMSAAVRCVDRVAAMEGFSIRWRERDWGSEYYRHHGRMMPEEGLESLSDGDGILLGAVGSPGIPDEVTLWGLLIPIRREFDQYVNYRPIRLLPGVISPLRDVEEIDAVIVRENVEGEYSDVGGRIYRGRDRESAIQAAVFTRSGVERVAEFAVDLAARRSGRLISATKSNGIIHTMPFWDEVVADVVARNHEVTLESILVDALAARAVMRPGSIDVIVASNLFGDILSDLLAAIGGSLGVAPSANLNPPGRYPSMFEPVHGSAPDIAGTGVANPVGQMWAAALMLEHLGEHAGSARLQDAFSTSLAEGVRTPDLGGDATTEEFTECVLDVLRHGGEGESLLSAHAGIDETTPMPDAH